MKKEILALLAAVALVGVACERQEVTEPAGAERDATMDQPTYGTDTNGVTNPPGAAPQDTGAGATGTGGTQGNP